MRLFVALTDWGWYQLLAGRPDLGLANSGCAKPRRPSTEHLIPLTPFLDLSVLRFDLREIKSADYNVPPWSSGEHATATEPTGTLPSLAASWGVHHPDRARRTS